MKKEIISASLIITVFFTSGCSGAWRKKFIRRKKDEDKQGPVLQPYDYKREFTNRQLYANHYVFWKNSESELIGSVKEKSNLKRIKSQANYSLVEINKLADLLVDEKQELIMPYVEELEDIVDKVSRPNYVQSNSNYINSQLSRHYRAVARQFSYFHMKNFVKPDEPGTVDEQQGQ